MNWLDNELQRVLAQTRSAQFRHDALNEQADEIDDLVKHNLTKLGLLSWPDRGIWTQPQGRLYVDHYAWTVESMRGSMGFPPYEFYVVQLWLTDQGTAEFRAPDVAGSAPMTEYGLLDLLRRYHRRGPHHSGERPEE